jgi:CrcB protein
LFRANDVREITAMAAIWVALGGAIGAVSRYLLSGWINTSLGPGPFAIFVVNISGAFLIGFITTLTQDRFIIDPHHRVFITVGILGGYTTFSTWTYETMQLIQNGEYLRAGLNSGGSLVVGLVAVYLGIIAARLI